MTKARSNSEHDSQVEATACIIYPYDKSAVTADLESWKILLNCMISENANWSTIDLTDFYLGTPLLHPEYIRIPTAMIPERVRNFFALDQCITSKAIYFSVHRTHYGLPQAGALSQQRLFEHLEQNGYSQCRNTPSFFRNKDVSVRLCFCEILTRCGRLCYTMDKKEKHGPFHRDTTTIIFGQHKLGRN
jgi:hypothetical protein